MEDKGKILYEAWAKGMLVHLNTSVEAWDDLEPEEQNAWRDAADALLERLGYC